MFPLEGKVTGLSKQTAHSALSVCVLLRCGASWWPNATTATTVFRFSAIVLKRFWGRFVYFLHNPLLSPAV